jgi:hypothetical protein
MSTPTPHSPKLRSWLRWLVGSVSAAFLLLAYVDFVGGRAINRTYFPSLPDSPVATWVVVVSFIAGYLFLVAVTGRWALVRLR